MEISIEKIKNSKIVVFDTIGPHSQKNLCFDRSVTKEKWYNYSSPYLYEACLREGIQLITADVYFSLPQKPKAICVRERDDINMDISLALKQSGVHLAIIRSSENPFYACRFYWNLLKLTSYFDHSIVMKGVESWVHPSSQFHPQYTPHAYFNKIKEVESNFRQKKFLTMIQGNTRVHPLKRVYVNFRNTLKPMPNFINREGYLDRLEAIRHFSESPDFDLYGRGWDKPIPYTKKYQESVSKSWRGAIEDKHKILKQYKFSLVLENSYLGGYVQYLIDSIYAGSVPIYWGAPDIAEILPQNCFIDFRKFDCDFAKLENYLRDMSENEYNSYIKNINTFISSPAAYLLSQENYASEMINIFKSYFI